MCPHYVAEMTVCDRCTATAFIDAARCSLSAAVPAVQEGALRQALASTGAHSSQLKYNCGLCLWQLAYDADALAQLQAGAAAALLVDLLKQRARPGRVHRHACRRAWHSLDVRSSNCVLRYRHAQYAWPVRWQHSPASTLRLHLAPPAAVHAAVPHHAAPRAGSKEKVMRVALLALSRLLGAAGSGAAEAAAVEAGLPRMLRIRAAEAYSDEDIPALLASLDETLDETVRCLHCAVLVVLARSCGGCRGAVPHADHAADGDWAKLSDNVTRACSHGVAGSNGDKLGLCCCGAVRPSCRSATT